MRTWPHSAVPGIGMAQFCQSPPLPWEEEIEFHFRPSTHVQMDSQPPPPAPPPPESAKFGKVTKAKILGAALIEECHAKWNDTCTANTA